MQTAKGFASGKNAHNERTESEAPLKSGQSATIGALLHYHNPAALRSSWLSMLGRLSHGAPVQAIPRCGEVFSFSSFSVPPGGAHPNPRNRAFKGWNGV